METTFSDEQQALRNAADRLAERLGPPTVASIGDSDRIGRLAAAIESAGLRDLRSDDGTGVPLASGVDVGIVARAFGRGLIDAPFLGPVTAADLLRSCEAERLARRATIALDPTTHGLAVWQPDGTTTCSLAIDARGADIALGLVPLGRDFQLAAVAVGSIEHPIDLTRGVSRIDAGIATTPVVGPPHNRADVDRVAALAQVLVTQDIVGAMEGAFAMASRYASERSQYGVTIGSFQAVQHALAEAVALVEGSISIALYASWAVDAMDPAAARKAADLAKVYCARAGRRVAETVVQVHGGIGNTWECLAHVFLRRILHSAELFGSDARHLDGLTTELLAS